MHRLDAVFGRPLPIASAGRSYAEQAEAYRKYLNGGPLALRPGTSVHESGNAIDWGNAVYALLNLYAGTGWRGLTINRHGHRRTVSSEVWHTEYDVNEDNFRGQGAPAGGSYAASVTDIQSLANKLGAHLDVDGIYGAGTAGWVRAFQGDWGLGVDGIVGPATWAKMQEVAKGLGQAGGPAIRDVQGWLNENLNAGLTIDGIDGPATQAAVKRYQGILGVAQDGVWGAGTEAAHRAQHPGNSMYGGAWIRVIQDKLNRLGFGPLTADGLDGGGTRAAVKRFQESAGLAADGIAGPATNNAMDQRLNAKPVGRNATDRPTVEIQNFLKSQGFDLGSFGADGDYGAATTDAVAAWQKKVGLEPDGVWGPLADAKAFPPATVGGNRTTRSTWDIQRLVGATADGVWGQETTDKVKAWQAANGLEADGIWGEASDAKGFPPSNPVSSYPTTGRNATTRETEKIQKLVGAEVDGSYGPNTSVRVAMWQERNKLDVDGTWGPASDAKGFPGVPLPDAPKDPATDPSYGKKTPQYPGAAWADVSPNKSVRTEKVQALILHHRADTGTPASARKRFMTANDRNVSPNWNVNQDGSADEIVPPDDYRAWTTGQIDHSAVTIETGNTTGEPNWGISDASHERIADILAWSAHRYGFPIQRGAAVLRDGKNVITVPGLILHRETPAGKQTGTICPGGSMDADRIILRAKELYQQLYNAPTPTPEPTPTPTPVPEIPAEKVLVNRQGLINLQHELDTASARIDELLDGKD